MDNEGNKYITSNTYHCIVATMLKMDSWQISSIQHTVTVVLMCTVEQALEFLSFISQTPVL